MELENWSGVAEGFRNSLWLPLSPLPPLSSEGPDSLVLRRGKNQPRWWGHQCMEEG